MSLYRYGKQEISLLQLLTPIFGVVFIILGILVLFNIIKF